MRAIIRKGTEEYSAGKSHPAGELFGELLRRKKRCFSRNGLPVSVVYASSSSVYGDRPELPKREDQAPAPISPYAVSKVAGEQYGQVWEIKRMVVPDVDLRNGETVVQGII